MRVRINVTAKDIRQGRRLSGCFCPIALACRRVFNDKCPAVINKKPKNFMIELGCAPYETIVPIPKSANCFAQAFDAGMPVKPFSFTVNAPASVVKKAAK